jgi:2-polyprenyl-3-methyl-5-hydroxy-6-metoxy-1,4-benzoquinol methylase
MNCKICKGKVELYQNGLFDDRYGYPGKFNVFVCNSCGFGQLEPQLKDSELSDLYTNYYPRQNITAQSIKDSARFKKGIFASIRRWFDGASGVCHYYPESKKRVLDVGCGNAVSLLEMRNRGVDAYGIEEDRNLEKPAKELGLKVEIGNIYNSKYPDNFFDYVALSQVLEHIPNPEKLLLAAKEKLKKNGVFIASFPNFNSIYRKICGKRWIHWHVPFHLNHFTKKSVEILARNAGFRIRRYKIITPTIWSILQVENMMFKLKEGESHEQWGASKKKESITGSKMIIRKILYTCMLFLRLAFSIVNKLFDYLKCGDGTIVFLEKK